LEHQPGAGGLLHDVAGEPDAGAEPVVAEVGVAEGGRRRRQAAGAWGGGRRRPVMERMQRRPLAATARGVPTRSAAAPTRNWPTALRPNMTTRMLTRRPRSSAGTRSWTSVWLEVRKRWNMKPQRRAGTRASANQGE